MKIAIIGAGIGGLTLALELHRVGIECDIFEAANEIKPVGVGINVLPHASQILCQHLGLEEALSKVSVITQEAIFFNRFGQKIYSEPTGKLAGYSTPQFSIHRGELQAVLLHAFLQRVGAAHLHLGWSCQRVDAEKGVAYFQTDANQTPQEAHADCVVACDGIHSRIRKQLHPSEGEPLYSGVNMWRGVTVAPPFLSHASMVRAGWLSHGKMVIYPIKNFANGTQLINWVAEIETPKHLKRDWNRQGKLDDFIQAFEGWHFDWLDVPALIRGADSVLEFPMIDQDPLPFWNRGKVTLLGDAAHPMYPRGSNGAGQAILDAHCLADNLASAANVHQALDNYQTERLHATANVVRMNRSNPPDAILREVMERTGDKPFAKIEDVMSQAELQEITQRYKGVTGNLLSSAKK